MKTIFITEKPSVAQEYRKVLQVQSNSKTNGYIEGYSNRLNKDVVITWAVGHLVTIANPKEYKEEWGRWTIEQLPMIPEKYKYVPLKQTYDQFKIIKSIYQRNDIEALYYAGDSGREGIYIQALIRNQIFRKKPEFDERVVWIDSFTDESILKGIQEAKPYSYYQPMIKSGYARAISDWLIGMNFTTGFSVAFNSGKQVNTGRVVTPTLALIVNRQKEIQSFKKTYYYGIKANEKIFWKQLKVSNPDKLDLLYNENGYLRKFDAEKMIDVLSKDKHLTIDVVKVTTKTEYAPYLFNLADLQAYCTKAFSLSPADTLKIAQELYEKKLTTYPRTDSRFLSTAVQKDLQKDGYNVPDRYVDDAKVTDHYAIIPTFNGDVELDGIQLCVYNSILKRFMDTMKPPYIYDTVQIRYTHTCGEYFVESFKRVKQQGYREQLDKDIETRDVPNKGDVIDVTEYSIRDLETKPPVPYTTGSLILAMEKAGKLIEDEELREQIKTSGLGTSATRANIIEKLIRNKYIEVDKNQKISPTQFGIDIIEYVKNYDDQLVSPVKTAEMEDNLHRIEQGELGYGDYLTSVNQYVTSVVSRMTVGESNAAKYTDQAAKSKETFKCPKCGKDLKFGRFGWYCTDKHFSISNEICGYKLTETDVKALLSGKRTRPHKFKWKSGKTSEARLFLKPDYSIGFDFDKK